MDQFEIKIDYEMADKITLANLKESYESLNVSIGSLKLRIKAGEYLERYEREDMRDFKRTRKAIKRTLMYYMDPMQQEEYFNAK